jgi:hypothetical protein
MTDQPVDADTPGRDATPQEEAHVRALLASLRDDDIPMPPEVWTRLAAVVAQERRSGDDGPAPGSAPTPLDTSPDHPGATVHRLAPVAARRRSALRWLPGAAAAVVVVALGAAVVHGAALSGGASSSAGAAASESSQALSDTAQGGTTGTGGVRTESTSGTAYTSAGLAAQVGALVASTTRSTAAAPAVPTDHAASVQPSGALLLAGPTLAACLTQLVDRSGVAALAVDRGSYDGRTADVLVLPTTGDARSLDVYVLVPGCTAANAEVMRFARIPRP